ncbi:YcxB family protein [Algoriphagus antarcticus]|uniref:YcxB family protein n=1 Tax=Algoriphagus antarcticus TaxID=238540 RepID=UPI000E25BFE4
MTSTVEWPAILQAEELPYWFLRNIGSQLIFYAIPKLAFTDEQQLTLKNILKNKGLLI